VEIDNPVLVLLHSLCKTVLEDDAGLIWIGFLGRWIGRLNPITSNVDHWRNEKQFFELVKRCTGRSIAIVEEESGRNEWRRFNLI